ncbi:hypothetical protein XH96_05700 [Bradyrhizobium sp. CCBAU 51765]|nr:hypothetical protein XH96_05700 [Bradyrhizobium sp. CCBAU 51765]
MGEGGFAERSRVRGSLRESSLSRIRGDNPSSWRHPLIRHFAPPSPTRGEGRRITLPPRTS